MIRIKNTKANYFPRFSVKLIKNKEDYEKNIHHLKFENANEQLIKNVKGLEVYHTKK